MDNNINQSIKVKHNCKDYPARWGENNKWICMSCGKENKCDIKYTKKDLKPKFINGKWYRVNPCCPLCPHKTYD